MSSYVSVCALSVAETRLENTEAETLTSFCDFQPLRDQKIGFLGGVSVFLEP